MPNLDTVIGVDASLTHTGYSILELGKVKKYGSICPKKLSGMERIKYIEDMLESQLDEYYPNIGIIEGYSFGSKCAKASEIHELGGVIKLMFYEKGIPLYTIAPTSLKKYFTASGRADKNDMIAAAQRNHGITFTDDNECDAFAISQVCHYLNEYLKNPDYEFLAELEKHQREVLSLLIKNQVEVI